MKATARCLPTIVPTKGTEEHFIFYCYTEVVRMTPSRNGHTVFLVLVPGVVCGASSQQLYKYKYKYRYLVHLPVSDILEHTLY